MTTTHVDTLFAHIDSRDNRDAFVLEDHSMSWAELDEMSRRYAAGLRALGVEKGDRVCAMLKTSLELVIALVGHYRLGAIHVPINTGYGPVEVEHILADSGAKVVLVDADGPAHALIDALWADDKTPDALAHQIVIGGKDLQAELAFGDVLADRPLAEAEPVDDDDRCLFIYTSGTTGRSKGVVHTYRSVVSNIDSLTGLWRWSRDDTQVLALPLFHVHGLGIGIHGTLIRGCQTQLLRRFDVEAVAEAIDDRGTIFMGVPTMYTRLVREMAAHPAIAEKLHEARLFTSGSAALPQDIFELFEEHTGHRILERYGMSETMLTLSNPYPPEQRRAGTVGFPVPGCQVRLVDQDMNDCEPGEIGQIVVRGDSLMAGYWRQPERTEDAFADGWFLTGDVGQIDDDGYFAIVGRQSVDIIKSGGYKISAREIEEVLRRHPAVAEVAVVGVADREWGERICAAVVVDEDEREVGPQTLVDALNAFLTEHLADYKKLRDIRLVDALPRNALGKVQKHRVVAAFEGA